MITIKKMKNKKNNHNKLITQKIKIIEVFQIAVQSKKVKKIVKKKIKVVIKFSNKIFRAFFNKF